MAMMDDVCGGTLMDLLIQTRTDPLADVFSR